MSGAFIKFLSVERACWGSFLGMGAYGSGSVNRWFPFSSRRSGFDSIPLALHHVVGTCVLAGVTSES